MEHEEGKQSPHKNPLTQLEEVNSDFTLAISLQEQDGTFTTLESESDSSSLDNDDGDEYEYDDDSDADFFLSQELESDLQFLESEGSNDEEDDIDLCRVDWVGRFYGKGEDRIISD